jgi:hypothetical protein
MPPNDDLTVPEAQNVDRGHQDSSRELGGDRFLPRGTQGTYQHPQIRSLIAKHYEQLSSGLVDIFRTEVEREVKQRVSEVIVSEATTFCQQLKSKDEALLAVETRCKGLREELELSTKMCCQLQERVGQLEAIEAQLNERLEVVRLSHPRIVFSTHPLLLQQRAGITPPPLENRHMAIIYERRESRMLCRLCV